MNITGQTQYDECQAGIVWVSQVICYNYSSGWTQKYLGLHESKNLSKGWCFKIIVESWDLRLIDSFVPQWTTWGEAVQIEHNGAFVISFVLIKQKESN